MKVYRKVEDIEQLERVHAKCSNKYVPIKTTEFINQLTNFNFVKCVQFKSTSSYHYVEMTKGEAVTLYIENSFDRTNSLRISFNYNGFIFGRIRQVHKGQPAKEIIGSPEEINTWYNNAINTIESMKVLQLSRQELEDIARVAFKERGIKLQYVVGINYNTSNLLEFVTNLVESIKDGAYGRISTYGTKTLTKQIKPVKREALMISINNKIWKHLEKNNPELAI